MARNTKTSAASGAHISLPNGKDDFLVAFSTGVTEKDADKVPLSAGKHKPKKYYIFELKQGKDKNCDNHEEAMEFEQDHADLIARRYAYSSEKSYNSKKESRRKYFEDNPICTPRKESTNNDERVKLILASLSKKNKDLPSDRFEVTYVTNGRSTKCLLFLQMLTSKGADPWFWKPKSMLPAIISYCEVSPPEDIAIMEAVAEMKMTPRPEGTNSNVAMTIPFTPPGSKVPIYLPIYTCYTFVKIPYEGFSSMSEEQAWIEVIATKFCEAIRGVLQDETYRRVLHAIDPQFTEKITNKTKGMNLLTFTSSANVLVTKCQHMSRYVTTDVATQLSADLYESALKAHKYTHKPGNATDVPVEDAHKNATH